jgi:ABC-type amino acid transport substrate-binding protein
MKKICFVTGCALALLMSTRAAAQEYKALIPQVSPATIETYKKLTAAIVEAGGAKVSIEVVPFGRAVYNIENKSADFLLTVAANPDPAKVAALKVDYSTADLFPLVFVVYANKAKAVDPAALKQGNPGGLTIETDSAHVDFFPFKTIGSTSMDSSLQKLGLGRIDAFVFAQPSTDAALKRLGLTNVTRQFYGHFTTKIILQKGARGGALDKVISAGLEKIKANGKWDELMRQYLQGASTYAEWQP